MQWVAIYTRISKDPLGLTAGVARQRKDCTAIAQARWPGHEIREYMDNDTSASQYSRKRRVEFERMCDDIRAGRVIGVVGWNFDRMFRKPAELETFLGLCDEVRFRAAITAQGDVDLTTDDGKLHARIMVAVAAKESDNLSRRTRRALQDRAERGLHHGRVPFGYRRGDNGVPIINPDEADLIRSWADRIKTGVSLGAIAREAPAGAPQSRRGIRALLLAPTLTGRRSDGRRGQWEPILSDIEQAELRSLLTAPDRRSAHRPAGRRWWLSGLVRCGKCAGFLYTRRANTRSAKQIYICQTCAGVAVDRERLTWHVEYAMFGDDDSPGVVKLLERDVATRSRNGETVTHTPPQESGERLAELAALYATGALTRAEWEAARQALVTHWEPPSVTIQPVTDLASVWSSLSPDQQHQLASRVIERVEIHPRVPGRPIWQPDRIHIHWLQ